MIIRIGEINFQSEYYEDAKYSFNFAMKFENTVGNPFIHLRLGQIQYFLKNEDRMIDELSRALIMGGEMVFEGENESFLKIPKQVLKKPVFSSWAKYEGHEWESTK